MSTTLVGRGPALAAIDRGLAIVRAGATCALRVEGPPGIGKSCILAALAARAGAQGLLVLEGRAAEFEDDLSFGIFVDALDDHVRALGPGGPPGLDAEARGQLATLFPVLARAPEASLAGVPEERYRVYRALRALLDALARRTPLVLVLDDVHWVDGASGELLGYLLTHPPSGRVLLALAYRPAQLAERLRSAVARAEPLEVGPLSRADAASLLGRGVAPDAFDAAYEESGGNPFYLLELARGEGGRSAPSGGGSRRAGGVPAAVVAAIEREIAALPAPARVLAHGAAVAGDPFDVATAAVAAGMTPQAAPARVDELVGSGLVDATDVPRRLRFRHPVVRRAVYEAAGPGWRVQAHRRLADALTARGASPVELAHHLEVTAEPGDETAISVLSRAAAALAPRAPELAARRLHAALRLLPPGEDDIARRLELLAALSASCVATGRLLEGRAALLDAVRLLPAHETVVRMRLETACAAIEHMAGLHADADRRLHAALDALPDECSGEAAAVMVELAAQGMWDSDWPESAAWAARAHAIAGAQADRTLDVAALGLSAWSEYAAGRPEAAIASVGAAGELLDALADDELARRLDAVLYVGMAEFFLEAHEAAVRHADRGLAVARATGQGRAVPLLLTCKAQALRQLGRLKEARHAAEEGIESARLTGQSQLVGWGLSALCDILSATGELEPAVAAGEESVEQLRPFGRSSLAVCAGWQLGAALLEAGDPVRCESVVLEAVGGPAAGRAMLIERFRVWQILARAAVARARLDAAEDYVRRLDAALPTAAELRLPRCLAESARAHVRLAGGDHEGAATAALAAARLADAISAPVDAARARLLAGRALGAAGSREPAIELLERARAELAEHGAVRHRDEALRELRRLGRRVGRGGPRAVAGGGVAALSVREREIAERVAAGQTNRQIGTELFLSTRTVERHLSHVFAKLSLDSRAQVGAALERASRR